MRGLIAALTLLMALTALPAIADAQPPAQSAVSFENSGNAAAQPAFLRGLALLHNFEYPRAAAAFREAQAADPGFVMAYWGEAMTYNHPIWMEQDADAARAALARLAPTPAGRLARARTERERGLLAAVEILYGDGTKEERDRFYSIRMAGLALQYPNDVDIQAFHALSLLGLAHEGRDVRLYMRAAAILEPLFPAHRTHPGVLHYLIHSYDDPTHAPLGLRAARLYGDVAPDAPHARHMTSHIYLALGMWDEVIEANVAADSAVDRLRAESGRPGTSCGHYNEWLLYGLYQRGRNAEAAALADACFAEAEGDAGNARPLMSWADMAVRGAIETDSAPRRLPADADPGARFTLAYADLLRARDAGRAGQARAALAEIDSVLAEQSGPPYLARRRAIVLAQAAAIESLLSDRVEEGLAELRRAAEAERGMPAEFGPPLIEKPSFELLGDELLRLGRRAEAAAAYRTALELAPARRLSLQGLAVAERAPAP